jgi:hypothetical protein
LSHENHSKDHKAHGLFKEVGTKGKPSVNWAGKDASSEDDSEVCVAEWVDTPRDKPLSCFFLKPSPGKKDEVKFTFDVSKCDKLFDVLLQNKVICLSEGHVIPPPTQIAKGKYCKWHGDIGGRTQDEAGH